MPHLKAWGQPDEVGNAHAMAEIDTGTCRAGHTTVGIAIRFAAWCIDVVIHCCADVLDVARCVPERNLTELHRTEGTR